MKQVCVDRSAYLDSISLMRISRKVSELPGIESAMAAMATDTNLLLLKESGFDTSGLGSLSAADMVIAIEARDAYSLEAGLALVRSEIKGVGRQERREGPSGAVATDIEGAVREYPEITLVLISIPGRYAAREARKALGAGKHVMIFSDNVSVEDELKLKTTARDLGLLLMGPDCGTALIGGIGLGFANEVPRGRIGIVAASGTGAQEVSSILARLGLGVSQIIGTGGRDVSDRVGGLMTLMGLSALIDDEATDVLVVVSKLPGAAVAEKILAEARAGGKPCVVYFAGYSGPERETSICFARTLTEAGLEAARLATGKMGWNLVSGGRPLAEQLPELRARLPRGGKYVRGLFSGGTLAQEAVAILGRSLQPMHVNMKLPNTVMLEDAGVSRGHTLIDLGDDAFTRGRAHPMIDQSYRLLRLAREIGDAEVALILLDVVLGYGCNEDPAGEIAATLGELAEGARGPGRPLVVASICGTTGDPQNYGLQRQKLEAAGVVVAETNALACQAVLDILGSGGTSPNLERTR